MGTPRKKEPSQGFERILRAHLQYVAGDFRAALADLRQVAAEFADRQGMSLEHLIERYRLPVRALRAGQ